MRKGERSSDWAMGGVGLSEGNNGESEIEVSGWCGKVTKAFGCGG